MYLYKTFPDFICKVNVLLNEKTLSIYEYFYNNMYLRKDNYKHSLELIEYLELKIKYKHQLVNYFSQYCPKIISNIIKIVKHKYYLKNFKR